MQCKIKIIAGFRKEQEYSIDASEAHKAYYLFEHPEQRGTFNNGLAILGADIRAIVPDYQGTMGWTPTHTLDSDDWVELHRKGVPARVQKYLSIGKEVARLGDPSDLNKPLELLVREKYPRLAEGQQRTGEMRRIGDVVKLDGPDRRLN
jgi:hypothetical protein